MSDRDTQIIHGRPAQLGAHVSYCGVRDPRARISGATRFVTCPACLTAIRKARIRHRVKERKGR